MSKAPESIKREEIGSHVFVSWEGSRQDLTRIAQRYTDREGKTSTVHAHSKEVDCNEKCYEIKPPKGAKGKGT
jgi:hypothetical protein